VGFVVNYSEDTGPHPLHIHGRNVQLVARASGQYSGTTSMPAIPIRRDTWFVNALGYVVIRFITNNPGVWFFHCHMEWHLDGVRTTYVLAN
jgi:iron transport multicopper oxidase